MMTKKTVMIVSGAIAITSLLAAAVVVIAAMVAYAPASTPEVADSIATGIIIVGGILAVLLAIFGFLSAASNRN